MTTPSADEAQEQGLELEPWAYLRDVLERLPGHPNSRIDELLPHRWKQPDA